MEGGEGREGALISLHSDGTKIERTDNTYKRTLQICERFFLDPWALTKVIIHHLLSKVEKRFELFHFFFSFFSFTSLLI